jgi:putative nucleotidyltransferase with HDIG domain
VTGRTKIFLVTATAVILATSAAAFVARSEAVSDLPIGLVIFVLSVIAGVTAGAIARATLRKAELPLESLAESMSSMALQGRLESDFPSVGGDREIQQIEEAFRHLVVTLEESQKARERSYVEALGAVVAASDARDHEVAGHSFRVSHYAVALAREIGLRGEELKAIEWGSLLHDIGKLVVPDEILRKVGPLTDEEWLIMRQHPSWGFEMLSDVRFIQDEARQIIWSHHERWDGEGYPRGLAGQQIPIAARIFAVVDTYDAITSDRPYRRARPHQYALSELERVAGYQLDPEVVRAFRRVPETELRRLRELCRNFHPGLTLRDDLMMIQVGLPEERSEASFLA